MSKKAQIKEAERYLQSCKNSAAIWSKLANHRDEQIVVDAQKKLDELTK